MPEKTSGFCPLACAGRSRWGRVALIALVIGVLAYVQYPLFKGMFYRVSNAAEPKSEIPWLTDYDSALAESKKTGKPVLIDFTADWCPPCKVMKHEVWPDAEVSKKMKEGYVPLLLDVDERHSAQAAAKYQVRAIPTILIVDAEGAVQHKGNFMSKSDMLKFLENGVKKS